VTGQPRMLLKNDLLRLGGVKGSLPWQGFQRYAKRWPHDCCGF